MPPSSLRLDPYHSLTSWFVFVGLAVGALWFYDVLWLLVAVPAAWLVVMLLLERVGLVARRIPPPAGATAAVLVTGCSSGIGLAAALELLRLGFVVLATVRTEEDARKVRDLADPAYAERLVTLIMDVGREEDVQRAAADARRILKSKRATLMAVVNNAGYGEFGVLELMPAAVLRRQLDVNVVGQLLVAQAFLPLLREWPTRATGHTARLVFVSSVVGTVSMGGSGAYCTSKFALEAMSSALRIELQPWSISVSVIRPGAIATEFTATTHRTLAANVKEARPVDGRVARTYEESVARYRVEVAKLIKAGTSHTDDAVIASLLDEHPLETYLAGYDSRAFPLVRAIVPDCVLNWLLGKPFRVQVAQ